jgi:hypothetical protein
MPRKRLTKAQGDKLLEDTKKRLRLEQEARTKARLEDLEIEVLENLGRQLRLECLELNGELECPEIDTRRHSKWTEPCCDGSKWTEPCE